jgi:ABC-2 type transport system ATP-binding protein
LAKSYGEVEAVKGVDFSVQAGEIFGFLGPNGAGKSTTINMLCTLVRPTAGSARVAGFDIGSDRDSVRSNIGLVFQDPTVDGYLTAEQNLQFHAELYGVPKDTAAQRITQVLEMVSLEDRRKSVVNAFSGGMRRRLEIARGLLHSPRVLFLDEPTVGLDPQTRASIWNYITELRRSEGITIFMTTHYMDEAEYCDRIAIMDHGSLVAIDTPDALKATVAKDRVEIQADDVEAMIAELKQRYDVDPAVQHDRITFSVENGEAFLPRLFTELTQPVKSVSVARPSLDDVFMSYTGNTIRDSEGAAPNGMHMMMARRGR